MHPADGTLTDIVSDGDEALETMKDLDVKGDAPEYCALVGTMETVTFAFVFPVFAKVNVQL